MKKKGRRGRRADRRSAMEIQADGASGRREEWAGRQLIPAGAWVQWPSSPPVPRSVSSISFLHSSRHVVVRACNRKQKERRETSSDCFNFGAFRIQQSTFRVEGDGEEEEEAGGAEAGGRNANVFSSPAVIQYHCVCMCVSVYCSVYMFFSLFSAPETLTFCLSSPLCLSLCLLFRCSSACPSVARCMRECEIS